jgi:hypothetical protein
MFEIPEERITVDGKDLPRGISTTFTLSLGDKSKLRPALESWRGRPFTTDELNGFDITKVLGANAYLNVTHAVKGDKTYANITTINPLPKGLPKRSPENKLVEWSVCNQPAGPIKVPDTLPQWIISKVMLSDEYIESHMTPSEPAQPVDGGVDSVDSNGADEEVPF